MKSLLAHKDLPSTHAAERHRNPADGAPRGRSAYDVPSQGISNLVKDMQPPQWEAQQQRNQLQSSGAQVAIGGQQSAQDGGELFANGNHARLQIPSQQRQELPFSFNNSPLPSLPGDIFADASRFDDGLGDMDNRTEFYENLSYVLSGSYE